MPDNNGNLMKQEMQIPGQTMRWQEYNYHSLNRLTWTREVLDVGPEQWKQQFTYDRWGNRKVCRARSQSCRIQSNETYIPIKTNRDAGARFYSVARLSAAATEPRQPHHDQSLTVRLCVSRFMKGRRVEKRVH